MNEAPPLLLCRDGIYIYCSMRKLTAMPIGDPMRYPWTRKERTFPEVEDLFALPLRGLLSRAEEFYNELKQ